MCRTGSRPRRGDRRGGFDAAANVTPDAVHYSTTMQLIAAGKDVFCEKPLATDYPHAREMADAADAAGIMNMVNLTYRSSPAVQKAREIILSGEIGAVKHFEARDLQSWLVGQPLGRLANRGPLAMAAVERPRQQGRSRRRGHSRPRLRHLCRGAAT